MRTKLFILRITAAGILVTLLHNQAFSQTTIFSEDFEGEPDVLLNGTAEDTAGAIWSANGFATTDGFLDVGQVEGSAVLPFVPEVGNIYTLSIDIETDSDRWVGIGFSQNGSSEVLNSAQDRFAQSGGVSWFLLRPDIINQVQQVEIFGGPNTMLPIPDTDENFFDSSLPVRSMSIVLDATSDLTGASFEADFLIDGSSVSSGPQTIDVTLESINFVGFTFEGPSAQSFNPFITVDNFLLTSETVITQSPLDCDSSGSVDLGDIECATSDTISELLETVSILPGDLDLNGEVAFADFLILSANFGQEVDGYTNGDIDLNGSVEFADFLALSGNFGSSSAAASVPEPTALASLFCIMLCGMKLRRRRS